MPTIKTESENFLESPLVLCRVGSSRTLRPFRRNSMRTRSTSLWGSCKAAAAAQAACQGARTHSATPKIQGTSNSGH